MIRKHKPKNHMFCHEMVDSHNLTLNLIIQWIDSAIEFIAKISDTVLSIIYPKIERAKIEYSSFINGSIYPLLVGQSILETTNELINTLNRKYIIYLRESI